MDNRFLINICFLESARRGARPKQTRIGTGTLSRAIRLRILAPQHAFMS
jgi:hypothetical protein